MNESKAQEILHRAGVENSRLEAKWLAEEFQGNIPPDVVQKRCLHYPLQYLLGHWSFWREEYEINENTLIPRADTELLVEKATGLLPPNAFFLDLCTGSGCVAISTLATRTDTTALAVDLYPRTLEVARRNAARNCVTERLAFLEADVRNIPPDVVRNSAPFDAILANPPYLTEAEMTQLQTEVRHEPQAALAGGEDGMDFYRAILRHWATLLKQSGFILFEIGAAQGEAICALAAAFGFSARVFQDLAGHDRVAHLTR